VLDLIDKHNENKLKNIERNKKGLGHLTLTKNSFLENEEFKSAGMKCIEFENNISYFCGITFPFEY